MLFVKVNKRDAEETRSRLVELGVFESRYFVEKEGDFVLFPVKECPEGYECVERDGRIRSTRPNSLKEALAEFLSPEELEKAITSFDIIGDIAIIQIARGMEDKAEKIADALMRVHKNVKVVCQKLGPRQGMFRVVPLKVLKGEKRFVTVYKENGVRMKVDLIKAYFSPRLSHERERIANQVRNGETIAALFAGVGPYPLVIAKRKKVKIYAVELNPYAVELMRENIKMNKLMGEIIPIQGDVREVWKDLPKCDRVLMPLPKGGEDFLDVAMRIVKPGGIVHFYQFTPEEDLYGDPIRRIEEAAKRVGRKIEVVNKKIVVPHKTRVYHVVIDFRVY